jgi:hypothetical protein
MAKFKVGDRVFLTKPKYKKDDTLNWRLDMEAYIGKVFIIKGIDTCDKTYLCESTDLYYWFCESWLTKAEELPIEQPTEKVESSNVSLTETTKEIDWEQRRWELSSKFYLSPDISTRETAIKYADAFIEYYKQKTKLK